MERVQSTPPSISGNQRWQGFQISLLFRLLANVGGDIEFGTAMLTVLSQKTMALFGTKWAVPGQCGVGVALSIKALPEFACDDSGGHCNNGVPDEHA